MNPFQIAYIPIGVPTFHLESAAAQFEQSAALLREISPDAAVPEKMLLSLDDLNAFLDGIQPSAIILQNITFANAAYASEVLHRFRCPLLLWTLREPVIDGGRLRLNSLTGAYSAANTFHAFGVNRFAYLFGGPGEEETRDTLTAFVSAARLRHQLSQLKMLAVGHTPQGFGFGRALDGELLHQFGVRLETVEARELIAKALAYDESEILPCLEQTQKCTCALEAIPQKNQLDHARLYKAYLDYVTENGIGALATRCWPDFFTAFGTPVCTVLAMLNDAGISSACEADIYGALSMYMGQQLTGKPAFFGDPVSLDEKESSVTFWHCGTAACSLAHPATGAVIGVHPNRKIGPAMDFGCAPAEQVTIFRIGRKPDGSFRAFIAPGEALDKPKQFTGTSLVVHTRTPAKELVCRSVKEGWEPHFAVLYGDVSEELEMLCDMLQVEICRY